MFLVYFEFRLAFTIHHVFYLPCCRASRQPITSVEFKLIAREVVTSVVIRAEKLKFVAEKVELEYTLRNKLRQQAKLYFTARQVGHARGNTHNNRFQFAMQQCCETS